MIVHNHQLSWYMEKLARSEYFSQGMYGDAEWIALFGNRVGSKNAEDTIYTPELCKALRLSLNYRADNFYFSVPEILRMLGMEEEIDKHTQQEFVEKDMWDREARLGGLVPFIKQLQQMKTCIISNSNLRALGFLHYDKFIGVSYPNCFPEIEGVLNQVNTIGDNYVYLISAGLPAAIFAQKIHGMFSNVFALDLGSIWDAFVRIGAQRGWRKELYETPEAYQVWQNQYAEVLGDEN